MRSLAFVLLTLVVACSSPAKPADLVDAGPPEHGFRIVSPSIDISPGGDFTYCYYFHTPNTSDMAIQRWVSHMTAGSQFMIVYITPADLQTPGTLSTTNCGLANTSIGPVMAYAAVSADAEIKLPADDGEGNAIGQMIGPNQSGFIQMHYLNTTSAVIHAHVELDAYAYPDGTSVIPAGPFVTFNRAINLPSGSAASPTTDVVNGTCKVLTDSGKIPRFFLLTTHTYKQGVHTFIKDGDTTLFDSTSWAAPGDKHWDTPPFYTFASGNLTYQCEYSNPNNYSIAVGDSAATDETCMVIGYYFPSPSGTGHFCLNSAMLY
ncbi:MAG TPA: hypothetical protein VF469_35020 [Kofleriaceae bacterium]